MSIVNDQIRAPTSARMLAEVTAEIAQLLQESLIENMAPIIWSPMAKPVGMATPSTWLITPINWAWRLKLDPKTIKPIKTKDFPLPAVRPANSRLDTTKVKETFGINLPSWQSEVDLVLHELIKA
jgi:dTDP-4-dehydrorhamnose reductase